jgi:hypothetical protein
VYLTFGLEAVADEGKRTDLMARTLQWLAPSITPTTLTVSIPDTSGVADDTIDVPVRIQGITGEDVTGYQVSLTYDPSVISIPGVNVDNAITPSPPSTNVQSGQIDLSFAGSDPLSGSGALVNLEVALDAVGTSTLTFATSQFFNSNGNSVSTTATDGSVTVDPPECPLTWSLDVGGTDASGAQRTVTLGQSPLATAGFDPDCAEEELPPDPPQGVLDLRFTGTGLPGVDLGDGTARDIRPDDTETGAKAAERSAPAVWRLDLQSQSYPVTLTWDAAALARALPSKPVRLVDAFSGGSAVAVNMKQTGRLEITDTNVSALEVRLDQDITLPAELAEGWNLRSVPVKAADQSFGALLGPCQSGFLFDPARGYDGLRAGDRLPPKAGGFFNCSAATAQLVGQPPADTIEVGQGWNIIGPGADTVAVRQITSEPAGIVSQSTFFGYAPGRGYQVADRLVPTFGYWVRASEAGTLDLSGGAGTTAAVASAKAGSEDGRATQGAEDAVTLRLTDAAGRTATLRLGRGLSEATLKRAALPPVPPGEVFDVRFESGRQVASWPVTGALGSPNGSSSSPDALRRVRAQGLQPPVTLRLAGSGTAARHDETGRGSAAEGPPATLGVRLAWGPGQETLLTAEEPSATLGASAVQTSGEGTTLLRVGLQAVPRRFALSESRPQPARQRATFDYAVPEAAEVQIEVYDLLGRRVATLAEGRTPAGQHEVTVEASRLPSGTYFVRMTADGFTETRRLVVVH